MAIYSCNISNVSRAKGSSACATLSYITAEKVKDERLGKSFSYGREERVVATETLLPDGAPERYKDSKILFNEIEKYEKADNARTAKKIMVALPREFDLEKQQQVIERFIKNELNEKGYAATYAIHHDAEDNNPHAHILVANRQIDRDGEWSAKRKMEYALDEKGERIPVIDKETGEQKVDKRNRKQWKRISVEQNPLDKKEMLQSLREAWARECNRELDLEHQIDHRSFADQGRDEEPTIHEGYEARAIEAKGGTSERCEYNREVKENNGLLEQIRQALREILAELARLFHIKAREEERNRAQYEKLEKNVRYIEKWVAETSVFDRLIDHKLPPYKGQEELAEMREHLRELNSHGWTPEYQEAADNPRLKELIQREQTIKKLVDTVTKGIDKGEPFESLVERAKSVVEGREDEKQGNVSPTRERGVKERSDDLER